MILVHSNIWKPSTTALLKHIAASWRENWSINYTLNYNKIKNVKVSENENCILFLLNINFNTNDA